MTPRSPTPPTATGRPRRVASSARSTSTKNESMSTWRMCSGHTSRSYLAEGTETAKLTPMAALVHFVRDAEVDNPEHIVCGDLPGYGLSPHGIEQARRAGRYLGPRPVVAIWSSPLERALRTAEEIAARTSVPVKVDSDLTDWSLFSRWKGISWQSLAVEFPGELDAYLDHPYDLSFVDEPLSEVAERVAAVARRLDEDHPHGDVVLVSHQDPIRYGVLKLLGSPMSDPPGDTPGHGGVTTLRPGTTWRHETAWEPADTPRFGEKPGLRVLAPADNTPPTSA